MSSHIKRVTSDEKIPSYADVVIIGGGIVGITAAYFLARKGMTVALVEKGYVAGEQSSRNWGFCRQQGRDEREIPLARESIRLWGRLQKELGAEFGFRRTGVLFVTEDEKELQRWADWQINSKYYGIDTRVLNSKQVAELAPGTNRKWIGGIHTPSDGRAEPSMAVPAMARGAQQAGATIHQYCAARGLETKAGKVAGVVTEQGEIHTRSVLCAAGAWSSMFCRRHGVNFPQLAVRGSVLRTEAVTSITEGGISSSGFCMRRRLDGGYNIAQIDNNTLFLTPAAFRYFTNFLPAYRQERGAMKIRINSSFFASTNWTKSWPLDKPTPFEKVRTLDPKPDLKALELVLSNFRNAYPALKQVKVAEQWAGMIDVTPDAIPIISSVDSLPGLFLATGFSGHGFGTGPGAGQLAADLVSGNTPIVDPSPFNYDRMVNGTRLVPGLPEV